MRRRTVLLLLCFQLSAFSLFAQYNSWKHSLEGQLLFTFKPSLASISTPSPNNTLLTYVYPQFKGYKKPGLYLGYYAYREMTKKISLGFSVGCNIRYMEPLGNSEYITYYSFPVSVRPEWHCFKYKKHQYSTQLSLGYQLKHPKHKTEDGTGGGSIGFHIIRFSELHQFYLRFGYDFLQENSLFEYKADPRIAGSVDETFHYTQYLNQIVFGIGKRLN